MPHVYAKPTGDNKVKKQKQISPHLTPFYVYVGGLYFNGLCWQHGHLRPRLLDKLLEVDLPQLFRQLLQLLFFVLERSESY